MLHSRILPLAVLILVGSVTAFVTSPPKFFYTQVTACKEVTFRLFAVKKKKNANAKSKGSGGGGFGSTNTKVKETASRGKKENAELPPPPKPIRRSAAEIARLNTYNTRRQNYNDENASKMMDDPQMKDDLEQETLRLTDIYTQSFLQTTIVTPKPKQLMQLSESPLLFTIENFIDPMACNRVQNNAAGCFDLMFPESVSDILFNGQESEMDGLLFNTANSREHVTEQPYPDGLHMDTNNQCIFRHVTCLLYLNDVPEECGGATLFPLARSLPNDPALKAARRLLDHNLSHTRSREIVSLGLEEDAKLLESRVGTHFPKNPATETTIRIQPKAGKLLVFFSRDSQGREDPRTWHAGERIRPGKDGSVTEKRILTLFKEVDYPVDHFTSEARTLEGYLAPLIEEQRDWLRAKAKLQKALLASHQCESTER